MKTELTRKSISLPESMWSDIERFRQSERITTEAEAIRRLLHQALKDEALKDEACYL